MSPDLALRFMNVGHLIDHFVILIFATAVLAIHQSWGLTYAEAIALGTPGFIVFAAATLPCGWLGDRWGGVRMMRVFFLGTGLATLATGFATGPLGLALGLVLIGLFAAIYHPVATAMVVGLADRPGRELGINGVWGNLGVALAAAVTAGLTVWLGWRAAFIVPGLASLAVGIAYAALSAPRLAGASRPAVAPTPIDPAERRRVFAIVAASAVLGGLTFNGVTIALPKLLEERLPFELLGLAGVGAIATGVFLCASFTQLFTGRLIDRVGPRPVMIGLNLVQVPLLAALGVIASAWIVPAAVLLMLAVFGVIPVTSWLLARYVPPAWRSRAYGVQFLLVFGVAALVVPLIAVLHRATGDTGALFLVLALVQAVVLVAALLLPGKGSHAHPRAVAAPAE